MEHGSWMDSGLAPQKFLIAPWHCSFIKVLLCTAVLFCFWDRGALPFEGALTRSVLVMCLSLFRDWMLDGQPAAPPVYEVPPAKSKMTTANATPH